MAAVIIQLKKNEGKFNVKFVKSKWKNLYLKRSKKKKKFILPPKILVPFILKFFIESFFVGANSGGCYHLENIAILIENNEITKNCFVFAKLELL